MRALHNVIDEGVVRDVPRAALGRLGARPTPRRIGMMPICSIKRVADGLYDRAVTVMERRTTRRTLRRVLVVHTGKECRVSIHKHP